MARPKARPMAKHRRPKKKTRELSGAALGRLLGKLPVAKLRKLVDSLTPAEQRRLIRRLPSAPAKPARKIVRKPARAKPVARKKPAPARKPAPTKPAITKKPTPVKAVARKPATVRKPAPASKKPAPLTRKPAPAKPARFSSKYLNSEARRLKHGPHIVREALKIARRKGLHPKPGEISADEYTHAEKVVRRRAAVNSRARAAETLAARHDPAHPLSIFVENVKHALEDIHGIQVAGDASFRPDVAGPQGATEGYVTVFGIADLLGPIVTIEERKETIDLLLHQIAACVEQFLDTAPREMRVGFDVKFAIVHEADKQGYDNAEKVLREARSYPFVRPGNFFDLINEFWTAWHRNSGQITDGVIMAFTEKGQILDYIRMDFINPKVPLPTEEMARRPHDWKSTRRKIERRPTAKPPKGFHPLKRKP